MLKRRHATLILRPDLTPFVNIALLLIAFFAWTTQLQRLNALPLLVPPNHFTCVYTRPLHSDAVLFLLANNRIAILDFIPDRDTATFTEIRYSPAAFRQLIKALKQSDRRLTLIIKPTNEATFGTIVGLLTELKRANELPFILSNYILPVESHLLARYATYKTNDTVAHGSKLISMSLYDNGYLPLDFLTPALPLRKWSR